MIEKNAKKNSNHSILYEGRKYKVIQLHDVNEYVMDEEGCLYDCMFIDKETNRCIGTFKMKDNGSIEITNIPIEGVRYFKNLDTLISNFPKIINSHSFIKPNIGKCTLAYQSKRFSIIELVENEAFKYIDKSMCDYVVFDGKCGEIVGTINRNENGKFIVSGITNWKGDALFDSWEDVTARAPTYLTAKFK